MSAPTLPNPRPAPRPRSDFRHFTRITTRWMDNDAYGHVNNVVYYSYFDTVVNEYLIGAGALDIERSPVIGLVVETHCNYFAPLAFPHAVEAGLRVARIGSSSVHYEIGLFAQDQPLTAARGHPRPPSIGLSSMTSAPSRSTVSRAASSPSTAAVRSVSGAIPIVSSRSATVAPGLTR